MGTCQSEGVGFRIISFWDIVPEYYHHKDNIPTSNVLLLIKHITVLPRYTDRVELAKEDGIMIS